MKTVEKRLSLDEIENLNLGFIVCTSFSIIITFLIVLLDLIKRYSNIKGLKNKKKQH